MSGSSSVPKTSLFSKLRANRVFTNLFRAFLAMEVVILILWVTNGFFFECGQFFCPILPWVFHGDVWGEILSTSVFRKMIVAGVPIMITAVGAAFNERVGIINIGLEGIMIFGAWAAVYYTYLTGDPWLGVVGALMFGFVSGLIHAVLTITFKAEQIVTGVAINLLALGITEVMTNLVWNTQFSPPQERVEKLNLYELPVLGRIFEFLTLSNYYETPVIGGFLQRVPDVVSAMNNLNTLIFVALLLVPICHIFLFHTTIGLRIRVIGEHPQAAATAGIPVYRYQYLAVLLSGVLAGLGGAILTIGNTSIFRQGVVGGKGFIALAAMIFGKWSIWGAAGAALFFGYFFALQINLGFIDGFEVPKALVQMIPYIVTMIALSGFIGDARPPKNIGKPYDPGESS